MGELTAKAREHSSKESADSTLSAHSESEAFHPGSNSAMIRELNSRLRSRSDEIRNTGIISGRNAAEDPESGAQQPEEAAEERRETAGRAEKRLSRLGSELSGDMAQSSFIRTLERTSSSEADRTKLVGMTETAESAQRRTEYLVREQGNKARLLMNSVADRPVSDDYFDFLRRRGEDEDNENSTEEEE